MHRSTDNVLPSALLQGVDQEQAEEELARFYQSQTLGVHVYFRNLGSYKPSGWRDVNAWTASSVNAYHVSVGARFYQSAWAG